MSPRELESERQRTLRLAQRRGRSMWMPVTVVILAIVGAAMAAGYFLAESGTEELAIINIPNEPADPSKPVA